VVGLACLLLVPGCSDDEGVCAAFTPARAPGPGTISTSETAASGCDLVELQMLITDVSDVFALDFDLRYDASLFAFGGVFPLGAVLDADGASLIVEARGVEGAFNIVVSRVASTGVDATGTRILLLLRFLRIAGGGATVLAIEGAEVFGSETQPQPKPSVTWSGGVLEIR
jgi:hypothetical protein